jgi:hypothetical protein
MALNAKTAPKTGGNFAPQDPLEAGLYPARVVQIVDLGLQPQQPYQGKEKPPAPMILLTYELSHEFMKDENNEDIPDKPRFYSEDFAFHNLEADRAKSTLRYKAIDPSNSADGDFTKLGGFPCQVMITKVPDKKNPGHFKNYVGNVSGAPKMPGYVQPALINPITVFDLDAPTLEAFERFPDWLKERIKSNLNYAGSHLEALLGGAQPAPAAPAPTAPSAPKPAAARPVPPAPKQV